MNAADSIARLAGAMLVAVALGAPHAAIAAPWQAEFAVGAESLSHGGSAWREAAFALRHEWAPRGLVELSARTTERYDRHDREIGIGVAALLADGWDASFGASASPSHAILPRSTVHGGLTRSLGDGWVLGGGLRSTRYEHDRADAASATLERYFGSADRGDWRIAATVVSTRLAGVASSGAWRLQLDRYLGDRARLGVLVAGGREIENLGAGTPLVVDTSSVVATGRWPIAPAWSLVGEVGRHRVGASQVRRGGRIGAQLDF